MAGDWRRSAASDVRQARDVSLIKSHENYKPSTTENDVALIKVSTPIDFNDDVQPVCAPDSSKDYVYNLVQCAGWGTLRSGKAFLFSLFLPNILFCAIVLVARSNRSTFLMQNAEVKNLKVSELN